MQHLQPNTTLQGGKYRTERVLGQGGFGITYLARNTVFDIDVAIKEFFMKDENERDGNSVTMPNSTKNELFDGQKEKFKKEAKRMFAIKNEHIIGVHDLFEENGTAYYVMDYVDGENLAERLKRTGKPMTEKEVREILPQILNALKSVHDTGIWHLDLKPGNVMIDKDGNVYLIDFGASKQIRANGNMTTSTALCYTPGYAPNEQIGQMYDRFGPWTDIYALGATIYNLLTNKKPPMAIDIEEDEEDAFDFSNSISEDMRKLVVWMMQPKRKARPQSIDELLLRVNNQGGDPKKTSYTTSSWDEETIISSKNTNYSEETIVGKGKANKGFENSGFVDLGLSVKWATTNLSADTVTPIGHFYKGVEISGPKEWDKIPLEFGGTCYDPATLELNNGIRLPSRSEWEELIELCTWKWENINGISGYVVIGVNGKSIFLPNVGGYWSGTIKPSDVTMSIFYLFFNMENVHISDSPYTILRCIRPVTP